MTAAIHEVTLEENLSASFTPSLGVIGTATGYDVTGYEDTHWAVNNSDAAITIHVDAEVSRDRVNWKVVASEDIDPLTQNGSTVRTKGWRYFRLRGKVNSGGGANGRMFLSKQVGP